MPCRIRECTARARDTGATWQDIIDVTVFLIDMKKDFPIYNRIYAEYFAGPAKTKSDPHHD